jgi:hypothetical protein
MPITTLQNISVPTEGAGSNSSLLMPKLQYRFRVLLDGFGTTGGPDGTREVSRQVVDVTRPNVSFEQMTIDAYNSRTYLAGKHTFFEQSSAVSSGTYKFQTRIEILDGGNGANGANVIDRFQLVGCYLESANYNSLAYATNEAVTTTLSIRYDNAIQFGSDESFEGIGETVTRAVNSAIGGTTV